MICFFFQTKIIFVFVVERMEILNSTWEKRKIQEFLLKSNKGFFALTTTAKATRNASLCERNVFHFFFHCYIMMMMIIIIISYRYHRIRPEDKFFILFLN